LCFERRFSKQNSVIRLKSNIFAPPKIFDPSQIFVLVTPLLHATKMSQITQPSRHKNLGKQILLALLASLFEFEFEFIDKQPMKAGQGLKSSLATQKHRKKNDTHTHK